MKVNDLKDPIYFINDGIALIQVQSQIVSRSGLHERKQFAANKSITDGWMIALDEDSVWMRKLLLRLLNSLAEIVVLLSLMHLQMVELMFKFLMFLNLKDQGLTDLSQFEIRLRIVRSSLKRSLFCYWSARILFQKSKWIWWFIWCDCSNYEKL